jgi:hypothetical protein
VPVSPTSQTNYTVTGTDQNGCKSTATVQVKVSACTGISERNGASQILIYPNPANGMFTIESPADMEVTLLNELGQVISTYNLTQQNERKIKVSGIAEGVYFIKGSNGSLTVHERIIITK